MKNLSEIIRKQLRSLHEEDKSFENYMFFGNLEQIKRQCEMLLKMDRNMLDTIIQDGHDWADDHVSEAKTNMDQVFDFFMNKTKELEQGMEPLKSDLSKFSLNEEGQIDEGKNKPTNPKLWAQAKSKAKSKFKVYPSAYANGWAAKWYKEHGGGWRKSKK
jgi:hypothetical protein